MSASTTTRRFRRYSSNSRPCVTLRSGTSLMEVPLRLLYGDGVSLAFAPRIALPPAPASSLFRPWPFHALSRPHRLPCSDPSASPFPASASSPRMAFPPATLPSLLRPLRRRFFFGSGALRSRPLLAPVPPVSVLPPAPPVPPSGSCLFPLSERGRIVPGWGCFVRLRLQKVSIRPPERGENIWRNGCKILSCRTKPI